MNFHNGLSNISSKQSDNYAKVALVDSDFKRMSANGQFRLGATGMKYVPEGDRPSEIEVSDLNNICEEIGAFIQPSSLDIPLGNQCFLIKDKVLPFRKNVKKLLVEEDMILQKLDADSNGGFMLLKNQTYLIPCGWIRLEEGQFGTVSPKSSIGRVDLMVRSIFDYCGLYDTVYGEGSLWMEVTPRSFNVRVYENQALTQLMVHEPRKITDLNSTETLPKLLQNTTLLYDMKGSPLPMKIHKGALVLSLDVSPVKNGLEKYSAGHNTHFVGYEALSTNALLDLNGNVQYQGSNFFRPIFCNPDNISVTLEKDRFYILSTKERISIPNYYCAEMVPFSHHVGELRVHYAGFFDPGFGYGESGEIKGTVGVLEVRPHETIRVYDGQSICLMDFFHTTRIPDKVYGEAGNHYQNQKGPRLAKYFK